MAKKNKPIPKIQNSKYKSDRLERNLPKPDNRGFHRSVEKDDKVYNIGLKDIDESIIYYFNNVVRPSVYKNLTKQKVPVIYGTPERWKAVQQDGFYRDKNGKIQTPLIMVRRSRIEKNRGLGNKLDANNPMNFGVFEKKYSRENKYDRFNIVNNRVPVKEYHGVVIPDYVNITYSCIIFTDFTEQMNKLIESINYASDSYWGDPKRYSFRAMIDSFENTVEINQDEDRAVKTNFDIKLLGHIIPDNINTYHSDISKFYSKAAINFKFETTGGEEVLSLKAKTPEKEAQNRFFDDYSYSTKSTSQTGNATEYLLTNSSALADIIEETYAIYNNKTILEKPQEVSQNTTVIDVFINKTYIPTTQRSILQNGADIKVVFDTSKLGFTLDQDDEIIMTGKFK